MAWFGKSDVRRWPGTQRRRPAGGGRCGRLTRVSRTAFGGIVPIIVCNAIYSAGLRPVVWSMGRIQTAVLGTFGRSVTCLRNRKNINFVREPAAIAWTYGQVPEAIRSGRRFHTRGDNARGVSVRACLELFRFCQSRESARDGLPRRRIPRPSARPRPDYRRRCNSTPPGDLAPPLASSELSPGVCLQPFGAPAGEFSLHLIIGSAVIRLHR